MSGYRFPDESEEYRARRDELLEMEHGHPRHVDSVWPYWKLLDMTPDGRGERSVPTQDFEHAYFSEHVLGEGG